MNVPKSTEQPSTKHETEAAVIHLDYPIVGEIRLQAEPTYSYFWIEDINPQSGHNKRRRLSVPNAEMKTLQKKFVKGLRKLDLVSPSATGGMPGSSPKKNVLRHSGNRYFYQLDIHSAYQQVNLDRLAKILLSRETSPSEHAQIMEFLYTYCQDELSGGLPTGSPSSPDLFNAYMRPVDDALDELAARFGLIYTRYFDDMAFSAPDNGDEQRDRIGKHKRRLIRNVLVDYSLPISHQKSRNDDIHSGPVIITGIQLNPNGMMQLPSRSQRTLLAAFKELQSQVQAGIPLDEIQMGYLGGFNGMLRAGIDKRKPFYSDTERQLIGLYRAIVEANQRLI